MCCNATLEGLMHDTFAQLQQSRPGWSSCNIHQIASKVQENAERMFNTTFEVISGVGDYARLDIATCTKTPKIKQIFLSKANRSFSQKVHCSLFLKAFVNGNV